MALVAALGVAPLVGGTASAASSTVSNAAITSGCTATTAPVAGFCEFERGGGSATVVDDARANAGAGYLRLDTPGTPGQSDKATVFAQQLVGTRLADLSTLEYETYIENVGASNNQQAPAVNIEVAPNKPGAPSFFTLVWEPLYTGATIAPRTWQQWSPSSTSSGRGGWWAAGGGGAYVTPTGTPNQFGFNTYTASLADVKAAMPDAVIGKIGINQGGGNDGLRAGVDLLKINDDVFDFDNPQVATTRATGLGTLPLGNENATFSLDLTSTGTQASGTCQLTGQTTNVRCTSFYEVKKSGNQITFRGTGIYNNRQPISFTATVVDGNPDSFVIFGAGQRFGGNLTSGDITVS